MRYMKGAKLKAWKVFSDYIRLRDCLKTTGLPDWCICVTCGKMTPYSRIQAGHAIGGRGNSILLHPDIVHGQCAGCNMNGEKHYAAYSVYMIKTYGMEKWEEFIALSKQPKPMKDWQWREETMKWREQLSTLKEL